MNPKIHASLAGWNSSARSCRESAVKFYYSYLGYKVDVGEWEVVEYVREHKVEILELVETFLHKPSPNQTKYPKAAKKLAKPPKPRVKEARRRAITSR